MRKKQIIMVALSLLLLIQPFVSTKTNLAQTETIEVFKPNEISSDILIKQDIGLGGEEQLKTNFNPNNGFEDTRADGGPEDYNYWGSAYQHTDDIYQGFTHSGSYSCLIQAEGTEQFSANAYLYRYIGGSPEPFLQEDIEMSFWYFIFSNPDIASGGTQYLRIRFYDSALSNSYYIYYYLSTNSISSNSSNYAYFNLNSTFSTWHYFQRDITSDFTAVFGAPTATLYFQYMYFYATSPVNPTAICEYVLDDVSVENAATYDWCAANGDFDDGDGGYWSGYNRGISSIYQTDDHTEGNHAINMTATTIMSGTTADTYIESYWGNWDDPPLGIYANQPGDLVLNFDWKYNEYNADNNHHALFYLYGYNGSHDFGLYWFLGEDSDTVIWGNDTGPSYSYYYLSAEGFGTRDVWNTLSIDVYEYMQMFNITNMPFMYSGIQISTGSTPDARTELLIDNFNIITDPVGDPSFEEDWYYTVSNSISSWGQNAPDPYISFTADAHSGDTAANLSSYNSYGTARVYRDTHINVGDNLFSDFWWKLDDISATGNNYAYVNLVLDDGSDIYYVFGAGSGFSASNTSSQFYYYVDNYNQLGTWNNLDRNIAEDILLAFGEDDWNITHVRFQVYTPNIELISLIIDDVHFVRDSSGPQLISALLLNDPTYYQSTNMEILAVDALARVVSTRVYYRTDVSWSYVDATMMGMYFYATIPAQDYGNTVEYYFVMTDSFGLVNTDNNMGAYYSYEILDDIDPFVAILSISTNADFGIESITLNCEDVGSGIDFVEIYDQPDLIATINSAPYQYFWDPSIIQESGIHEITVVVYDLAGNTAEASFEVNVTVYEAPPGPGAFASFFQKWGTLMGAAFVGTAWIGVITFKFFRKPKT